MKIVTHSGPFHTDDVLAVATLSLYFKDSPVVVRSRDPEVIATGDFVVDVGGKYDGERFFDHHQGGLEPRENGIPYASIGLVWKRFGVELCGSERIAELLDIKFVQATDALDNGILISKPLYKGVDYYDIFDLFKASRPTWKEDETAMDAIFLEQVEFAKRIITREIKIESDAEEGRQKTEEAYHTAVDKRIIILERYLPWEEVLASHPEPLFVAYPGSASDNWHIQTVRSDPENYINRKDFPEEWAGHRDGDLVAITGVPDAVFAHKGKFFVAAKSREGAIKLAELAVAS